VIKVPAHFAVVGFCADISHLMIDPRGADVQTRKPTGHRWAFSCKVIYGLWIDELHR
jgi:hypothetical protein